MKFFDGINQFYIPTFSDLKWEYVHQEKWSTSSLCVALVATMQLLVN